MVVIGVPTGAGEKEAEEADSGKCRMLAFSKVLGSLSEKKYGIFWEFFPYGGGGSHQIPKLL